MDHEHGTVCQPMLEHQIRPSAPSSVISRPTCFSSSLRCCWQVGSAPFVQRRCWLFSEFGAVYKYSDLLTCCQPVEPRGMSDADSGVRCWEDVVQRQRDGVGYDLSATSWCRTAVSNVILHLRRVGLISRWQRSSAHFPVYQGLSPRNCNGEMAKNPYRWGSVPFRFHQVKGSVRVLTASYSAEL